MYRIIAFDGGGIRSIFTARLLSRLEQTHDVLSRTHMLAGNSGGAIVAAALACGYQPEQVVNLFRSDGPSIFKDSFEDNVRDLFDLTGARYDGFRRKRVLETYLGDRLLEDLNKKIVLTSFDLKHKSGRWKPVSFHNFRNSIYKDLKLVDAVMASSAAQTYFPIYPIGDSKFSDGGIWANNPSMSALVESINEYRGGQNIEDVVILNIGTILNKLTLAGAKNDLGILDWLQGGLLDMILDSGAMDAVSYYCKGLLGARYHRVNTLSDELIKIDDVGKIDRLLQLADEFNLDDARSWLDGFWV